MLEARAAVKNLHAYRPPLAGRTGLRLDFNESTVGCSPRVLARLRSLDSELLARYPEREPVENEVASFLGLDPAQVLLTNGVDEAIHLLCMRSSRRPKARALSKCVPATTSHSPRKTCSRNSVRARGSSRWRIPTIRPEQRSQAMS